MGRAWGSIGAQRTSVGAGGPSIVSLIACDRTGTIGGIVNF